LYFHICAGDCCINILYFAYPGEDPISAHNRYPELWAKINREIVEEWKSNSLKEDKEDGLVFFMRAGFRDSPKWGMLFWEGDQMVSWQANDGIKSSVVGLLSSGISGYAFNHSDIGGYCTVNLPIVKYRRSQELLLRWMELNSFTTVFRTHEVSKNTCNMTYFIFIFIITSEVLSTTIFSIAIVLSMSEVFHFLTLYYITLHKYKDSTLRT